MPSRCSLAWLSKAPAVTACGTYSFAAALAATHSFRLEPTAREAHYHFRHQISPSAEDLEAIVGWDALGDQAEVKDIIDNLLQGTQALSPTGGPAATAQVYENVD